MLHKVRESRVKSPELTMYNKWNKFLRAIRSDFFKKVAGGKEEPVSSWGQLNPRLIAATVLPPFPPLRTLHACTHGTNTRFAVCEGEDGLWITDVRRTHVLLPVQLVLEQG